MAKTLLESLKDMPDGKTLYKKSWWEILEERDADSFREIIELVSDWLADGDAKRVLPTKVALKKFLDESGRLPKLSTTSFVGFMGKLKNGEIDNQRGGSRKEPKRRTRKS